MSSYNCFNFCCLVPCRWAERQELGVQDRPMPSQPESKFPGDAGPRARTGDGLPCFQTAGVGRRPDMLNALSM